MIPNHHPPMKMLGGILVFLMILCLGTNGFAQNKPSTANDPYTNIMKAANTSYNKEEYAQAIILYRKAIQLDPTKSDAYRNSARSYFWLAQYPAAVAYYDMYLVEFSKQPDREQISRERRLASTRAKSPWSLPKAQKLALESFERELSSGFAIGKGGAGAWKAYQALLQSGYAHPNLLKHRKKLADKLIKEHDGSMATSPRQPTPTLDLDAWDLQKQRLEAAMSVQADKKTRAKIEQREFIYQAANALLLSRYEEAATKAEMATNKNPKLLFLRWWYVIALMHASKHTQALKALKALDKKLKRAHPSQREYVKVLRAMVYQQTNKQDEAATIYLQLIP